MSCPGGVMGQIFGHKFRARFSDTEQEVEWLKAAVNQGRDMKMQGYPELILKQREYVCDICERCGERRPR